jgi:S1-C subfamily serine protease
MLYFHKNSVKYCLALLLTLVVMLTYSQEQEDITLEFGDEVLDPWNKVDKSCGAIIVPSEASSIVGTGFVVNNMVITASHVIKDHKTLYFSSSDALEPYLVELVYNLPDKDIAVLKFKEKVKVTSLKLGKFEDVNMHSSVMLVGFDKFRNVLNKVATFPTVIGYGTSIEDITDSFDFLAAKAKVLPAYSGGPIFNGNGEVIAILRSGYVTENIRTKERGTIAIAVSIDPLRAYLESEGVMAVHNKKKSSRKR